MVRVSQWPWPRDRREDRAKRVAQSYRHALENVARGRRDELGLPYDAAGELYRLDTQWLDRGAYWILPTQPDLLDPDDWLRAADLAHLIDRTPRDIYNWARRGQISQRCGPDGTPEYSVSSVIEYQKRRQNPRKPMQ